MMSAGSSVSDMEEIMILIALIGFCVMAEAINQTLEGGY